MTRPFKSFWEGTCSLGRREGVEEAAESQHVCAGGSLQCLPDKVKEPLEDGTIVVVERSDTSELLVGTIYTTLEKDTAAGRALDEMVSIAGSRIMFGGVLTTLVGWAIAGAVLGAPDLWQIILQDTSSIQVCGSVLKEVHHQKRGQHVSLELKTVNNNLTLIPL